MVRCSGCRVCLSVRKHGGFYSSSARRINSIAKRTQNFELWLSRFVEFLHKDTAQLSGRQAPGRGGGMNALRYHCILIVLRFACASCVHTAEVSCLRRTATCPTCSCRCNHTNLAAPRKKESVCWTLQHRSRWVAEHYDCDHGQTILVFHGLTRVYPTILPMYRTFRDVCWQWATCSCRPASRSISESRSSTRGLIRS